MPVRFIPGLMSIKIPTPLPLHCRACSSFSASTEMRTSGNCWAISCTRRALAPIVGYASSTSVAPLRHATSSSSVVAHLKLRTPRSDQHPQSVSQLRRFDVHPPAIGVAVQQRQRALDVRRNQLGIDHQRRSQHVFDARHGVALDPNHIPAKWISAPPSASMISRKRLNPKTVKPHVKQLMAQGTAAIGCPSSEARQGASIRPFSPARNVDCA